MTQIIVALPSSISKNNELALDAMNAQQLFQRIRQVDEALFNTIFREINGEIRPKGFLSMFINDEHTFDLHHIFKDGDHVVFEVAIAGG